MLHASTTPQRSGGIGHQLQLQQQQHRQRRRRCSWNAQPPSLPSLLPRRTTAPPAMAEAAAAAAAQPAVQQEGQEEELPRRTTAPPAMAEAAAAAAAQPAVQHDGQEEELRFTHAGRTLVGTLVRPPPSSSSSSTATGGDGRSTTTPAVILCHGYASHRNGFQMPALARALAAAGFASLRFDFAGNGESEGQFVFAGYEDEAAQIAAAKAFLEQQEQQQQEDQQQQQPALRVVCLLGHSKGVATTLGVFAPTHDDPASPSHIPLQVAVAGRFDMSEGITERFGRDIFERVKQGPVPLAAARDDGRVLRWALTEGDLKQRLGLSMAEAARGVARARGVLIIHGTADAVIPVEDGRALAAAVACPNCELVVVDGADHNFKKGGEAHVARLCGAVVDFVRSWTLAEAGL